MSALTRLAIRRYVKMDDILAFVHLIDDSCYTWSLCNFASCFCSDYHWMMDGLIKGLNILYPLAVHIFK
jgi:hypothetical protein